METADWEYNLDYRTQTFQVRVHLYVLSVYTTQVNSAFLAFWLVNSEVISQYYSPPSNQRERF